MSNDPKLVYQYEYDPLVSRYIWNKDYIIIY